MSRTRVALLVAVVLLAAPVLAAGAELTPPVGGAISDPLTGGLSVFTQVLARPVTLSFVQALPSSARVGQEFTFSINASQPTEALGGQNFTNALFVIKVMIDGTAANDDDLTLIGTGNQPFGYKDGYFYWGPSGGFALTAPWDATTVIAATAHTIGNYTFTAWCVDLLAD